ncbi:TerB N-terminal domain-containing protein [Saccharophagus degradans]|uniref:tellurite resistance TerB family protein n=1 Tax=Saccharophagus degradans TaxID=86304 RepID=UPI00247802DE|nr:TerB N-terminal domain-containing protein [Saccharophagus degradans]WGO98347.1 TerB N-terminal domain-containing protein [Saccharophagus degradans]
MEFWLLLGGGFVLYLVIKSMKKSSAAQSRSSQTPPPKKDAWSRTSSSNRVSTHIDDDEDEEDFATFTISYGHEEAKSKNKTTGKWVRSGESISVKGHTITGGNFYFGGQLASLDGYGTEASLVDDTLKADNQPLTYEDDSLGYWPKYNSISDKCRGALLSWLASERNDPAAPLGYVFIYFYGLERRVVVDSIQSGVDDTEFKAIFEEILRLKDIYGTSRSFLNYATRLLEIMCLLRPNVVSHADLERNPKQDSVLLKHKLAKAVDQGNPIQAELALAWLKFIPDYNLRKPARRCAYEFSQMFIRLYVKKYNEGIVVKPNKTRLKIEYYPASSTLRGIKIPHEDLPDPSSLKGPTNKLTAIADECTEALDSYSRYLGKSDTSRTDIAAVLLLPEELNDIGATLGLSKFKQWAEDSIENKNGIVDFSEFWQFTKTPLPAKINKKESELIQSLAERAGLGLVPDTRYHHAKPSVDGKLVLFSEGHGKYFEPSQAFNETGMTLRLGAMVATIDSHVDEAEFTLLKQLIDHDTNLSPTEKRSLHSYLIWRLNTASNVTGLKARLEKLGANEKAAVSKILIGVALADGKIDPNEVKQIEKLYTLLGLDKSLVTSDIHNVTTRKVTESNQPTSKGFELDESALAIHESQTKDVQSMLSAIFVDEEPIEETPTSEEYDTDKEDIGIDAQHYALYENLINRDRWSRNEMDELCKKLGLMTSGAIETINDWSFEKVDAPVLEEEADAVYVDQEIVEELEG